MKRVGIYSGTFDPIHEGHLAFAREALTQCSLDKVFFLVEPRPRRKQGVKALEHRDEMVRLAIQGDSRFGSIMLGHQRFTTTETLPVLMERFRDAELHMLMGDDILVHFIDWPHVEALVTQLKFVIGLREYSEAEIRRQLDIIQKTRGFSMEYLLFQSAKPEVSSTGIKQQVKQGKTPKGLQSEVWRYIKAHNLYTSTPEKAE